MESVPGGGAPKLLSLRWEGRTSLVDGKNLRGWRARAGVPAKNALEPRSPSLATTASAALCALWIQFLLNLCDNQLESANDIVVVLCARFCECASELLGHLSALFGSHGSLDFEIRLVANDTHGNVVYARIREDLIPDDGHHLEGRFRSHRIDDDVSVPGRRGRCRHQMHFVVSLAKGSEQVSYSVRKPCGAMVAVC